VDEAQTPNPQLVQWTSTENTGNFVVTGGGTYDIRLPQGSQAANCLVLFGTAHTFTGEGRVTDNLGNKWSQGPSVTSGTQLAFSFYVTNIVADTRVVHWSPANDTTLVSLSLYEFANCANSSVLDKSSTHSGSGTTITAGSLTPTASGDILIQWTYINGTVSDGAVSAFTVGSQPNIAWRLGTSDLGDAVAMQWGVYNSTSAINPTMRQTTSGDTAFLSIALALKTSTSGNYRPPGVRVIGIQHLDTSLTGNGSPLAIPFPTYGNAVCAGLYGSSTNVINTWTDNFGNIYEPAIISNQFGHYLSIYCASNAKTGGGMILTLTTSSLGAVDTIFLYDIVGAATTGMIGRTVTFGGVAPNHDPISLPTLSPVQSQDLFLFALGNDGNSVSWATGIYYVSTTFTGESGNNVPVDRNDGFAVFYSDAMLSVTPTWHWLQTTDIGGYNSIGVEIKHF
jgi:hypothetical protein